MKKYFDAQLAMFILLALGASILSSHGAFQFFKYLVDEWLAWVFILVVALGIIGLDAAGTATQGRARAAYYSGMAFFLVLETLANYFAGQAGFVAQIVAKLPPSSDLRMIAEQSPVVTRVLVVLFLSLASLAVAFFTFAATVRIQQIRAGVEGSIVARLRGLLAQRRALVRRLAHELRHVRADVKALRARFEHFHTEVERLRMERDQLRSAATQAETESAALAVQLRTTTEQAERESAAVRTLREKLAAESARADRASADLAEQSAVLALDVRSIAARLRTADVSLRTIADALGVSEKTIRNWTSEKVEV